MYVLILCLGTLVLNGQTTNTNSALKNFPKEDIKIVSSSNILLSGQVLYYQTTSYTNKSPEIISDMVYVELISDAKEVIFKHKLRLENGMAHGDHFLSTQLKTGHYKLIAYTEWTLNNAENAFDQNDIYVINPYLDASQNNLKSDFDDTDDYIEISKNSNLKLTFNKNTGIFLSTNSKTYNLRSKVVLQLQNSLNPTHNDVYNITVKRLDSIEINKHITKIDEKDKSIRNLHLPEMRGELIRGKVISISTYTPASGKTVSLSIPGETLVYKSTRSNDNGEFYLNLYEPYEQEKGIMQIVGDERQEFKIEIEPKVFAYYDELQFYPLKLDANLKDFIEKNSLYNQVESAYYNLKKDSIYSNPKVNPFYGEPDIVYVLDDYSRFPSVKETFIEVVQNAAIRQTDGQYRFLVYDYDYPFGGIYQNAKPLLLLDGVQIQDENLIVDYDPNLLASVSLVKGVYSIGSEKYNGIIDIKLKKHTNLNLSGSYIQELEIQKPEVNKKYFKQEHKVHEDRIPDFRTQLLWMPSYELNSNQNTIEFYTSDIPGYYLIEVRGTSAEGKSIYLTDFFEVTDKSN